MLGFSLLIKDTHAYHLVKQPHHPKQQSTFLHEDTPVPMLSIAHKEDDEPKLPRICRMSRRRLLDSLPIAALSIAGIEISSFPVAAMAAEDDTESFLQRGDGFAYRFVPPAEMEAGAKPVKTHLFEVNWKSPTNSKYTFGVTVDPVRIQNLKEFGTPEEVAAKVVLAEVNRDGVFEVTLVKDPVAVEEGGIVSYILNYLSQGKRGDKRFVAKFCIQNQRLYALTAQVLETDYKDKENEIMKAVSSFRVLP